MNRFRNVFAAYLALGLLIFGVAATQTNAQGRRSEREIRDIVRTLRSKIDDFQYNLNYQLRSNSADSTEIVQFERNLRALNDRINNFENNLDLRRENSTDVSRILNAAANIDNYLRTNPQNRRIENDWTDIRRMLDRLAAVYNGNAIRRGNNYPADDDDAYPPFPGDNGAAPNNLPPPTINNSFDSDLTGTYSLDATRSEKTSEIIADINLKTDTDRRDLEEKLRSPEQIAIDVRGNQVILASSNAAPINFVADGTTRTETVGGRTVRVRAALRGDELTVSSLGGETDYTVIFAALEGGKTLKVTRRITTDYLNQTVFADSFYRKSDDVARLGINPNQNANQTANQNGNYPTNDDGYSSSDQNDRTSSNNYPNGNYPTVSTARRGAYIIPNGTIVTGILENDITTKASQNNDRFKMTVQSPNEFRGATLEGYISGLTRSGQVSGRSQITFNFERITLRNGQTYDFAGFLQSVTDQNGKNVRVDAEGAAKGDNQTTETAKRGGIGAGLGAIIGAIAGGGKGAAIGAIIGGSAGAGSVIVQGRDDLELKKGSSITVQASSPLR